jgi:hypothetical protein
VQSVSKTRIFARGAADDDVVVYRLQRPDRRGRTALLMTPVEFLARLAAILPAPRLALRRQLGVFWMLRPPACARQPAKPASSCTRFTGPQMG